MITLILIFLHLLYILVSKITLQKGTLYLQIIINKRFDIELSLIEKELTKT